MMRTYIVALAAGALLCAAAAWAEGEGKGAKPSGRELFAPGNLVAWCIVPFDAKMRGPEERAEMLQRLGIKRLAYDWRAEHIPTFDQELDALQKRGIRLDAFWFPSSLEPEKDLPPRQVRSLAPCPFV